VNFSAAEARRWILGFWGLTAIFTIIREAQNAKNPGRPLPRPFTLLGSAAGFSVIGLLAELLPSLMVLTAGGITVGAFVAPVAAGKQTPIGVLGGALTKLNAISGGA
jgi:hypothetical protein